MFIFYQELLQKFKIKKKIKPVILSKYIKHIKIHHIDKRFVTMQNLCYHFINHLNTTILVLTYIINRK